MAAARTFRKLARGGLGLLLAGLGWGGPGGAPVRADPLPRHRPGPGLVRDGASLGVGFDTVVVSSSGPVCSNAGPGTAAAPYCTITAALTAHHAPGTTILVMPGTYREQVTLPASGLEGSPITLRALGTPEQPVVIEGAEDYENSALWQRIDDQRFLAPSVTWTPKQVRAHGVRLTPWTDSLSTMPLDGYAFVAGTGLVVNVGGDPSLAQVHVGRRRYGFYLPERSNVVIQGFTIQESDDRGIQLTTGSSGVEILGNTIRWAQRFGIQAIGSQGVRIADNVVAECGDHGISLTSGTTGCTIERNEAYGNAFPTLREANGIYLFGAPANVIRGNRWHHNQDSGEQIQSGSNDVISVQNISWANGDHGYDHLRATGAVHVGDVAYRNFRDGFSFEGAASGCSLHDCIATENGLTTNEVDLWADDSSLVAFDSDDNILWNSTSQPPIKQGLLRYTTVGGWSGSSGRDARTFQADPLFVDPAHGDFHLRAGSRAIDSANSGVPDWPDTDAEGHVRFDDPLTPDTGTGPIPYADRGALECPGATSGTTAVPPVAPPVVAGSWGVSVRPNPMRSLGEVVFETRHPGPVRVGIFDLTGRCVRALDGGAPAAGGSHRLALEATREDGRSLEPGIYYVRVHDPDGARSGRFVIVR